MPKARWEPWKEAPPASLWGPDRETQAWVRTQVDRVGFRSKGTGFDPPVSVVVDVCVSV